MTFVAETEPLDLIRTFIVDNWEETFTTPIPSVRVVNQDKSDDFESDMSFRMDLLNEGDAVIIKSDGPERIYYRGNITYIDKLYPISIEIITKENRQRVRNLAKMIRAICLDNKWDVPNWQLVRLIGYQESVAQELNIWRAVLKLQVENYAVGADTLE